MRVVVEGWVAGLLLGSAVMAFSETATPAMEAFMEVDTALQQARMALLQTPEMMPRHERLLALGAELHALREARLAEVPGMAENQARMRELLGRLARIGRDDDLSDEQRQAAREEVLAEMQPLGAALGEARRKLVPDAARQALQAEADALAEEIQAALRQALEADPETAVLLRERDRLAAVLQDEAQEQAAPPPENGTAPAPAEPEADAVPPATPEGE